ncbi:MAG TPA: IS200/IS605 family transposase [Flavobacteriaceae bacterium]|nr:IS200/IS605 family transposase [Flavobacteriaceae bacterium]
MSWVRIWIHLVFSTKNRKPFLRSKELRLKVFQHIKENAKNKGIYMDSIGGHTNHVHCLISLGREQSVSKVAQLIKGESSYWINKSELIKSDFKWQNDFWAVSVSESHLNAVRKYIKNQEEHHRVISFTEEVDNFMKKYGWKYIK